jgi:hypothetical protein
MINIGTIAPVHRCTCIGASVRVHRPFPVSQWTALLGCLEGSIEVAERFIADQRADAVHW